MSTVQESMYVVDVKFTGTKRFYFEDHTKVEELIKACEDETLIDFHDCINGFKHCTDLEETFQQVRLEDNGSYTTAKITKQDFDDNVLTNEEDIYDNSQAIIRIKDGKVVSSSGNIKIIEE